MRRCTAIRSASLLVLGLAVLLTTLPSLAATPAQFGVAVSITIPPPDLPVYDQPACPGDNYIWVPGYWAWDDDYDDYYWVPGTWVLAPEPGLLWTPGYWSWNGASFIWIDGYWGPVVGFYGGVNYGFGYFGNGYAGGHWDRDRFYYNREVNNVNVTVVHNVYNERVERFNERRVSYDGGNGGLTYRPTAQQEAAARERHVPPVADQRQQMQDARSNRQLSASVNHGRPPIAATPKAADFRATNVVAAREAGTVHGNPGARPNGNTPPGNRMNPNQPNPSGRENRNAPERTQPPPNENPRYQQQPQQPQMNQAPPSKQERKQQQKEQRQEEQQMRNRPPEQPPTAPPGGEQPNAPPREEQRPREERPQPQARPQAPPQREERAPAQKQEKEAPPSKERKQEQEQK